MADTKKINIMFIVCILSLSLFSSFAYSTSLDDIKAKLVHNVIFNSTVDIIDDIDADVFSGTSIAGIEDGTDCKTVTDSKNTRCASWIGGVGYYASDNSGIWTEAVGVVEMIVSCNATSDEDYSLVGLITDNNNKMPLQLTYVSGAGTTALDYDTFVGGSRVTTTGNTCENVCDGAWHTVVWVVNATGQEFYVDGTECTYAANQNNARFWAEFSGKIYFGTGWYNTVRKEWEGKIQEYRQYSQLTDAELDYLVTNPYICMYDCTAASGGTTPSLSINTNMVNSSLIDIDIGSTFTVGFNGTSVNNSDIYDCSVLFDGVVNKTRTGKDLSVAQNNISVTLSDVGDWLNITLECSNENASDYESAFYFVDLTLIPPSVNVSQNNTSHYDNTVYTNQIAYTDKNLFEIGAYIRDTANTTTYFYFNETNVAYTDYQVNISNSTAAIGVGQYMLFAWVWDSHTDDVLKKDYKIKDNGIWYGDVFFWCDDFKSYDVIEKSDSLSYEIKFDKKSISQFCYYNTSGEFIFIKDSDYPNHYIDYGSKTWIDDYGAELIQVEKNKLMLRIMFDPADDKYITQSVGDMNYAEVYSYFNITAAPDLNTLELMEINSNLETLIDVNQDIGGNIMLSAIIFLWLGLWAIGLLAFIYNNEFLGGTFMILTIPVDVYFAYVFQESRNLGTGFVGIAMTIMVPLTIAIIFFIRRKR